MPKITKNSSQIKQQDIEVISMISIRCAAKLQEVISTLSNPKDYAKRVLSKKIKSDKNRALIRLILNAHNELTNQLISPDELNKQISINMMDDKPGQPVDMSVPVQDVKLYIPRRDMTWVTKQAQNLGILLNVRGKREIRKQLLKQQNVNIKRQNKDSAKSGKRTGGGWSAFKITPESENLKKIMSSPVLVEFIHNSFKKSGLLHEALKRQTLAEFYTILMIKEKSVDKKEEDLAKEYFKAKAVDNTIFSKDFFKNKLYTPKSFIEYLESLNDSELEKLAEILTNRLIDNPIDYNYLLLSILKDT